MPWACATVAAPRPAITPAAGASLPRVFIASPIEWWSEQEQPTLGAVPRSFLDGFAARGVRLVLKISCQSTPSQRDAVRLQAGQFARSCGTRLVPFLRQELQ